MESSRRALKNRLFHARITNKIVKEIRGIAMLEGEADEPVREIMFLRVSKIHIPKTSSGLVEMDFVDDGDRRTPLRLQDTFRVIR